MAVNQLQDESTDKNFFDADFFTIQNINDSYSHDMFFVCLPDVCGNPWLMSFVKSENDTREKDLYQEPYIKCNFK